MISLLERISEYFLRWWLVCGFCLSLEASSLSSHSQGTLLMFTIPVLYNKYGNFVDKCCGMINHQFSKHLEL
ncbi:hypothetical protein S245_034835 [Arachis hypogaea]